MIMDVQLVNRPMYELTKRYLHKVTNLIAYMYEAMLLMQPEMYIYTQEGMYVSQIQLIWKNHDIGTMSHIRFYVCNNTVINKQIKCIKQMFDIMVNQAEKLADSPFYQLLKL